LCAAVNYGRKQTARAWSAPRHGFGNAQLIGAIAILLVIGLLLMVQAGELALPRTAAKPSDKTAAKTTAGKGAKAGKDKSKSGSTAPPPLFVMAPAAPGRQPGAELYLDRRRTALRDEGWRIGRTQQAFAYMDEAAAAQIVSKLDPPHALTVLSGLDERALGRILEAAPPDKAAEWTRLLLERGTLPPVPSELTPAAAERGMFSGLDELLKDAGYAPDGTPLRAGAPNQAGSPVPPTSPPTNGTPPSGLTPPGQPAGTATPPGSGTPASGNPSGGAPVPPGGTPGGTTSNPSTTPAAPGAPGTQPGAAGGAGGAAPGGAGGTPPPPVASQP
jgi:hypothetical protein